MANQSNLFGNLIGDLTGTSAKGMVEGEKREQENDARNEMTAREAQQLAAQGRHVRVTAVGGGDYRIQTHDGANEIVTLTDDAARALQGQMRFTESKTLEASIAQRDNPALDRVVERAGIAKDDNSQHALKQFTAAMQNVFKDKDSVTLESNFSHNDVFIPAGTYDKQQLIAEIGHDLELKKKTMARLNGAVDGPNAEAPAAPAPSATAKPVDFTKENLLDGKHPLTFTQDVTAPLKPQTVDHAHVTSTAKSRSDDALENLSMTDLRKKFEEHVIKNFGDVAVADGNFTSNEYQAARAAYTQKFEADAKKELGSGIVEDGIITQEERTLLSATDKGRRSLAMYDRPKVDQNSREDLIRFLHEAEEASRSKAQSPAGSAVDQPTQARFDAFLHEGASAAQPLPQQPSNPANLTRPAALEIPSSAPKSQAVNDPDHVPPALANAIAAHAPKAPPTQEVADAINLQGQVMKAVMSDDKATREAAMKAIDKLDTSTGPESAVKDIIALQMLKDVNVLQELAEAMKGLKDAGVQTVAPADQPKGPEMAQYNSTLPNFVVVSAEKGGVTI